MSETKHTPTPWRACAPTNPKNREAALDVGIAAFVKGDRKIIAEVFGQVAEDAFSPARANAEFIVRACNSFDDLLAACKAMVSLDIGYDAVCKMARAAIANAED